MTKAIIFFATPHRGILFDDIREMVGDGSPRLDLVHSIGRGQEAEDLLSFTRYVEEEHFRIMSFSETMQTKQLKQDPVTKTWTRSGPYYTVLERKSSILNLPRDYEEVLCAEGDHSTLVKFSNKLENTYTTILGRLSTLLDHIVQASSGYHAEINSRLRTAVLDKEYSLVSILLTLGKADPTLPAKSTKDARMLRLLSLHGAKGDFEKACPGCTVVEADTNHSEARQNGIEHWQIDDASGADRGKILAWLSRLEPEKDHERIQKKRHRDTGQWFLESPKVQKWREEDKMSLLWCYGNPGVGKSVLTSTLLEDITTQYGDDKAIGIAYFYFSYQATASQEPEDVFSIWIKQLCRRQDGLPNSLRTLYKECIDNDLKPKLSELDGLIQEVINTFKKVFVVIDALDECSMENRNPLVNYLVRLSNNSHCTLKFFIASRREVDVERILLSASFSTFPVEVTKVDKDIATYITHELEHREQDLFELDEALKEAIQTRLLTQSNGMFLWVKCQLDYIYEQPSRKDIMVALNSLPDTVAGTYERMFKRINSQTESMRALAHRALCWLVTAKRALSVKELAVAVAIKPIGDFTKLTDPENMYSEKTILTSCCGFITNECGTVRPIHFTVHEFLKDKPLEIHEGVTRDILATMSLLKSLLVTDFKCQKISLRGQHYAAANPGAEWKSDRIVLGRTGLNNLLEYSCTFLNLHLNDLHPLPESVLCLVNGLLGEKRGILRSVILEVFRSQGKKSVRVVLTEMELEINPHIVYTYRPSGHPTTDSMCRLAVGLNDLDMRWKEEILNQKVTPLILLSSLNLLPLYFRLYPKPVDVVQLNSILHQVVRNGSVSAVKELLNRGCDIEGYAPLLAAIAGGREEVAMFLIAEGAYRFNGRPGPNANLLLYYAHKNGMINTAKALINNGADAEKCRIANRYELTST